MAKNQKSRPAVAASKIGRVSLVNRNTRSNTRRRRHGGRPVPREENSQKGGQ
jgi:hypothetical protein